MSRLEHVRLGGGERQPEEVLHLRRVRIRPTAQHRGLHDGEVLAQRAHYDLRTGHQLHRRRQYGHPEPGADQGQHGLDELNLTQHGLEAREPTGVEQL